MESAIQKILHYIDGQTPYYDKYTVAEILRERREERALPEVWVDPTRCVVGVWDRNEIVAREELLDNSLTSRRANLLS